MRPGVLDATGTSTTPSWLFAIRYGMFQSLHSRDSSLYHHLQILLHRWWHILNKTNLDFTVTHADMPPTGSLPEGFRFMWAFAVNGENYRVTAKSAEIGKPNPVDQSGVDQIGKVHPSG